MVKRSENGDVGGLWLQSYGLLVGSEVMGRFYRVRKAASSLQLQSDEPVVASYGATKTATLTMLSCASQTLSNVLAIIAMSMFSSRMTASIR